MVDQKRSTSTGEHPSRSATADDGRRASRIIHDERGNARVEWLELPQDFLFNDRTALTVLKDGGDSRGTPERARTSGFNPYQRAGVNSPEPAPAARPKRDLRKLSEWIKVSREVAARKARGDDVG
jgi:hypothetical protein